MHRPAYLTFLAILCIGCAMPTSPRRPNHSGRAPAHGGPAGISPRDTLEQTDRHLRQRGFAPLGPAVHNSRAAERSMTAYALHVRPGSCFVSFVIGGDRADLTLVVMDPWGRSVGYHVGAGSHPFVEHCSPSGGRYTARVQIGRGTGQYYYASYGGPQGATADLAAFFGSQREAAVQKAELDPTTAQRLDALDAQLGGKRYTRTAEPHGVVLGEGEARRFPLNLQEGRCYAFVSLAGPGAADTDVAVMDGTGNELVRDAEDARDGLVQFCPASTGAYQLQTGLIAGRGPVFVAGYLKEEPPPKGKVASAPVPEPPAPDTPLIDEHSMAGAGLEENFRLLDADMLARGYRGYGDSTRGKLAQGDRRDFSIQLEGGKCYAILAVGDNTVRDLDLVLLDPDGRALDRDVEAHARPIVRVCPERSGKFTMRVEMTRGGGDFVYAPYHWPRGTRGPFGLAGLIYVRLAEVTALLEAEGYAPSPDYTPEKGRLARQGATATHDLQLQGGQCYSLLAVGGDGVNNLDLTLFDGNRSVGTDGTLNAFPSVRHCPERTGRYRLRIQASQGSGEYFYQVFTRSDG
jgi:hypothetical protein